MKKKLAILSTSLGGGGAERVIAYLLEEMKDDCCPILVLMEDMVIYEIPEDVTVHFLDKAEPNESGMMKLLKLPYLGWKYKHFCKSHNIDISLAFMNRPSYISIFAKIFGSNTRTVVSERSTPSELYKDNSLASKINRFLIKRLYPVSDLIVSNSRGNRQDLVENFDVSPSSIVVLHNPLDIGKITHMARQVPAYVNFSKFTYLAVGRLDHGKNHSLLLDAFAEMKNKDTQLIILGAGPLKEKLEEKILSLGLADRAFLVGFSRNPYQYMARADALVLSSNYEGFPNVLIEALACGLPVISTDCKSGPREILAPQYDMHPSVIADVAEVDYGILVRMHSAQALAKAMSKMMENRTLFDTYKEKAKRRAIDFEKGKLIHAWKTGLGC